MPRSPLPPYPLKEPLGWLMPAVPVAWLLGEILKDRFLPLNVLFYLPPLGAGLVGLIWAVWNPLGSGKSVRGGILTISLLALLRAFLIDFQFNNPAPNPAADSVRLIHWNASRGRIGPDRLATALLRQKADIILLSEAPPDLELLEIVPRIFPTGSWYRTDGMTVMSRFPITPLERLDLPDGRAWVARIKPPAGAFDLLAADLRANVFVARKPDLLALADWIDRRNEKLPLLTAGDFNTPPDSLHFRRFRENLIHAHEAAGGGWPYSWTVPFPMIQIDHVWTSPGITPRGHRYRFALGSDHLMQVFDFKVESPD